MIFSIYGSYSDGGEHQDTQKNAQPDLNEARNSKVNTERAISHYNLAVTLVNNRENIEAEKELHLALSYNPNLVEALIHLGSLALKRGDIEGCLKYNRKAVKIDNGCAIGWSNIGFIKQRQGKSKEAIAPLKKSILYDKNFLQAYVNLANAYIFQGQIDKCIETNLSALTIDPNSPIIHNNLTIAYLEKGDFPKAVKHCDLALKLGYKVANPIVQEINQYR